jgi:hypothetical protein
MYRLETRSTVEAHDENSNPAREWAPKSSRAQGRSPAGPCVNPTLGKSSIYGILFIVYRTNEHYRIYEMIIESIIVQ